MEDSPMRWRPMCVRCGRATRVKDAHFLSDQDNPEESTKCLCYDCADIILTEAVEALGGL